MLNFKPEFFEKLMTTLDNNAVLMQVEKDGTYHPVWCSAEFCEMMEETQEDIIRFEKGGFMKTIHPDDREAVAYLFLHHKTKAGSNNLTIRKHTVKGNWLWVNVHYAFIEEEGVCYAYCMYVDVTEVVTQREQTKAMYASLNQELDALAEESLTALRLNMTRGIVEKVRGKDNYAADVIGASVDDIIRVRVANMPLLSDQRDYLNTFDLARLEKRYYSGENVTSLVVFSHRSSGKKSFIKYTATVSKDPTTGDMIALCVENEYNAEKVAEVLNGKVLARQYDMVCYLVGDHYGVTIGEASYIKRGSIFPKTRDGSYLTYINEQVLTAADPERHDKEALRVALAPSTIEAHLMREEPYIMDVHCLINGETFIKRFMYYVVDAQAKFYLLLKSDITELIKEQKSQNDALAQALEQANQANVAKTAFLSSMSHEIRTPMNAIIGLDSIALNEEELLPTTREYLEKIGESARHLLSLINDILDMSRIESGRMILRNEEFSFSHMLEQINTMMGSQCQEKGLDFDCVVKGKVDEYYIGDEMKLKQVIINILGNAIKFTPEGGKVSFCVERVATFDKHATIRFVIKDTGIGMDEAYLPKVFDAFSQEDGNRTNEYGGTGLGMAITKNIVEKMNGNISVESKKEEGTTFTVNVSLKETEHVGNVQFAVHQKEMHVLVVDDDPIDLEHAKLVLEEVGIAADAVESTKEALEMVSVNYARRKPYNLILIDLKMPEMDGVTLAGEIREIVGEESAIVILTGFNWDDVTERAVKVGVDSFIAKPLFASAVMDEFAAAFQKKHIRAQRKKKAELKGRRILLAEDVPINAQIMRKILSMRGMESDHAVNGRIAVDMFNESEIGYYDAVLMDIRMPVLDGLQATEKIRKLDRQDAKTVPIIAMTANAFDEDVQQSLQAGMNAHLSKPMEPEHLFETLEGLIND